MSVGKIGCQLDGPLVRAPRARLIVVQNLPRGRRRYVSLDNSIVKLQSLLRRYLDLYKSVSRSEKTAEPKHLVSPRDARVGLRKVWVML